MVGPRKHEPFLVFVHFGGLFSLCFSFFLLFCFFLLCRLLFFYKIFVFSPLCIIFYHTTFLPSSFNFLTLSRSVFFFSFFFLIQFLHFSVPFLLLFPFLFLVLFMKLLFCSVSVFSSSALFFGLPPQHFSHSSGSHGSYCQFENDESQPSDSHSNNRSKTLTREIAKTVT